MPEELARTYLQKRFGKRTASAHEGRVETQLAASPYEPREFNGIHETPLAMFEILHRFLVSFRGTPGFECSKIAALARLGILFAGI